MHSHRATRALRQKSVSEYSFVTNACDDANSRRQLALWTVNGMIAHGHQMCVLKSVSSIGRARSSIADGFALTAIGNIGNLSDGMAILMRCDGNWGCTISVTDVRRVGGGQSGKGYPRRLCTPEQEHDE